MAELKAAKTVAPAFRNELCRERVVYDFAVDGGAQGDFDILKAGKAILVNRIVVNVLAAVTGTGTKLTVGKTGATTASIDATAGDLANINADTKAIASSSPMKVPANASVTMSITAAAMTAGKLEFIVEYYQA